MYRKPDSPTKEQADATAERKCGCDGCLVASYMQSGSGCQSVAPSSRTHLVGVRDEQRALSRAVVVQHRHNLHRRVRLARAGRAHHHGQPRLYARGNGLNLFNASGDKECQ